MDKFFFPHVRGANNSRPASGNDIGNGAKVLFIHCCILVMAATMAFWLNEAWLFNGLDGSLIPLLVREQHQWVGFNLGLGFDHFQAMGNVSRGINVGLILAIAIQTMFTDVMMSLIFTHVFLALQYFLATYMCGRLIGLAPVLSIAAGWLAIVFLFPFIPQPMLPPTFANSPSFVDTMFWQTIILVAFRAIGRVKPLTTILCFGVMATVPSYMALTHPVFVVMTAFVTLIYGIVILLLSRDRRETALKSIATLVAVAVPVILGVGHYLYGLTFYSVPAFFAEELLSHQSTLNHGSIIFNTVGVSPFAGLYVGGSVVGALIVIIQGRGKHAGMAPRTS